MQVKTRFMPPPGSGAFSSEAAAIAAAACCGISAPRLREIDAQVFVAKKIITMDPSWPEATAIAVGNGKILSVGTLESLEPFMSTARSVVVDRTFEDKVIVPGFIDPHQHPLVGGIALSICANVAYFDTPNPYGPPIKGLKNKDEIFVRLRKLSATVEPFNEPLLAWGYDSVALGGHLDADFLDSVSKDRAVGVWDCSMHFAYCNRALLKIMGKLKPIPGIVLGKDGEPIGQFLGVRALQPVVKVFTERFVTPANAMAAMKHITDMSHQNGITTVAEMMLGGLSIMLEEPLFREFYSNTDAAMRCVCAVDAKKVQDSYWFFAPSRTVGYIKDLCQSSTERLIFNGKAKFFSDDAFLALGMQLNQPGYLDGHDGIWINEPRDLARLMLPYWRAGLQLHVHSNGDAGQDSTLSSLAELQLRHPRFDHRFTFEHYGMSSLAISRKVKELGAICSVNAYYPHLRGEINERHLGTDRAHLASRLRTLVDLGIPTAIHTDVPVAPPVPLEEMWIATERRGQSGKVLGPEERVTRYQALKMKTVDAAYVLGMDHLIGSIEAGKLADFTVLDADPLEADLRSIQVWGTVVGGHKYPRDHAWSVESVKNLPSGFYPGILSLKVKWSRGCKRCFWQLGQLCYLMLAWICRKRVSMVQPSSIA